ncbi:MAG: 4-(cytidine 5'-diphospho)-2-C-methyl-D-erythritol kinase, partial [Proteobacteria bacterium]
MGLGFTDGLVMGLGTGLDGFGPGETGAGLGGGSGNAAAVLRMANTAQVMLSENDLLQVAAKLGADVPLFLGTSPVVMEGIGERLTSITALEGWVVLLKPREGFATPTIYRAW